MPTKIGSLLFYTVEELAEKFKANPATIYGYIRSGTLSAKRFGKQYQIEQRQLEKFFVGDLAEVGHGKN